MITASRIIVKRDMANAPCQILKVLVLLLGLSSLCGCSDSVTHLMNVIASPYSYGPNGFIKATVDVRKEGEGNRAVVQLEKALEEADASRRSSIAAALGQVGADEDVALPVLFRLLSDKDAVVRTCAVQSLGHMETPREDVVLALIARLDDDDTGVRREAARTLPKCGEGAVRAVPRLIEIIREGDQESQRVAAIVLGRIGPLASSATGQLTALAAHSEGYTKLLAVEALWRISHENESAVPPTITLLRHHDCLVALGAVRLLGSMASQSQEAAAALKRISGDPSGGAYAAGNSEFNNHRSEVGSKSLAPALSSECLRRMQLEAQAALNEFR